MDYIEDILIIGGAAVIIATTFLLSTIAGLYCLGFALLFAGILIAKFPRKGGSK